MFIPLVDFERMLDSTMSSNSLSLLDGIGGIAFKAVNVEGAWLEMLGGRGGIKADDVAKVAKGSVALAIRALRTATGAAVIERKRDKSSNVSINMLCSNSPLITSAYMLVAQFFT
jgi:hypothetical protein